MKKIIAILLTLVLCISLVACGTDNQENQKNLLKFVLKTNKTCILK